MTNWQMQQESMLPTESDTHLVCCTSCKHSERVWAKKEAPLFTEYVCFEGTVSKNVYAYDNCENYEPKIKEKREESDE